MKVKEFVLYIYLAAALGLATLGVTLKEATSFFQAGVAENLTVLVAAICKASPDLGLRPVRAARWLDNKNIINRFLEADLAS